MNDLIVSAVVNETWCGKGDVIDAWCDEDNGWARAKVKYESFDVPNQHTIEHSDVWKLGSIEPNGDDSVTVTLLEDH